MIDFPLAVQTIWYIDKLFKIALYDIRSTLEPFLGVCTLKSKIVFLALPQERQGYVIRLIQINWGRKLNKVDIWREIALTGIHIHIYPTFIVMVELTEHEVPGNILISTNLVFHLPIIMKGCAAVLDVFVQYTVYSQSVSTSPITKMRVRFPLLTSEERSSFLVFISANFSMTPSTLPYPSSLLKSNLQMVRSSARIEA